MALTIHLQVSRTGSHAPAAFAALATVLDTGAGFSFDDSGLVPGHLVLYRARRRDDTLPPTCQFSDWTYTYGRAPFPPGVFKMNAEDIITGVETAVYVGVEDIPGLPVKVTDQGAYTQGGVNRDVRRAYSRSLRNAPTLRRKSVHGLVMFEGSITVEVSPEGFFPRLMLATLPVETTDLTAPTRHVHRFSNRFGSKTVTLVQRKGDTIFVYPGTRVTRFETAPNAESDTVLEATFGLMAFDELVYELAKVPTILTDIGIAAAGEDALDCYSHQDAELTIANAVGGLRSQTFTLTKQLGRRKVGDGRRGATGSYEGQADATGSASAFWENNANLYRDIGLTSPPAAGFAVGDTVVEAPVQADFVPPLNAAGFSNELRLCFPAADVKAAQAVTGTGEVPESLTFIPIDQIGNAAGTDFYVEVTNAESNTDLTTPAAPFVGTTAFLGGSRSKAKNYDYGKVSAGATTTVFATAANVYLSAADDKYVGRILRFLTGALTGQERTITAYVGSSRTFTVGVALSAAPAVGDVFGML